MSYYHKKKQIPISERILKEINSQAANHLNSVTPRIRNTDHQTLNNPATVGLSEVDKSLASTTLEAHKAMGTSIHVQSQKQLKKEMIDPSIAASIVAS